jgi:hypothetical protein
MLSVFKMNRVGSRKAVKLLMGIGMGLGAASMAHGQVLFTTTSDFTGWSASGKGSAVAPSTAFDSDGSTTNGLGNDPGNSGATLNAGATSPGGSLDIKPDGTALGFNTLAFSPGEGFNSGFMSAIDPGSVPAFSAASNFGPGSTVATSGTLLLTYSVPTFSAGGPANGGFYELGLVFNYDNGFNFLFNPTNGGVSGPAVDGFQTFTESIPYSINAGSLSFFAMGIAVNADSNAIPSSDIFVDNIAVAPVPEPVSAGLLCTGFSMLAFRRRRRA